MAGYSPSLHDPNASGRLGAPGKQVASSSRRNFTSEACARVFTKSFQFDHVHLNYASPPAILDPHPRPLSQPQPAPFSTLLTYRISLPKRRVRSICATPGSTWRPHRFQHKGITRSTPQHHASMPCPALPTYSPIQAQGQAKPGKVYSRRN